MYTNSCGCVFEVDLGSTCCGYCHCYCDSSDALDSIYGIEVTSLCDTHK
jgi:hypothetical protein